MNPTKTKVQNLDKFELIFDSNLKFKSGLTENGSSMLR